MGGFARASLVAALIVIAAAPAAVVGESNERCADVAGIGWACASEGGYRVTLADGSVQWTHGVDPAPAPRLSTSFASIARQPLACVDDTLTKPHVVLIYARRAQDPDRYAQTVPVIREAIELANGLILAGSTTSVDALTLATECDPSGAPLIRNEALDIPQGTFSAIASALAARGYADTLRKHAVLFDGSGCGGCAGLGTRYEDSRPGPENYNNGGPGAQAGYSVTWTDAISPSETWFVMLHELSHNLGAVNSDAPFASGGGHCNDGFDLMCYADHASNSSYSETRCPTALFYDCGADTYFDRSPDQNEYLATHWNIASSADRYLVPGPGATLRATCRHLTCESVLTTTFAPETTAFTNIVWGDGSNGTAANHTYASRGTFSVVGEAVDQAGRIVRAATSVSVDGTPPTTRLFLSGNRSASGWFSEEPRAWLTASDDFVGVMRTSYALDEGSWTEYVAPFAIVGAGVHVLNFASVDRVENVEATKVASVHVDLDDPALEATIVRANVSAGIRVEWTSADATSGLDHVRAELSSMAGLRWPRELLPRGCEVESDTPTGACDVPIDGPGHYCVLVSAVDRADRATSRELCTLVLLEVGP